MSGCGSCRAAADAKAKAAMCHTCRVRSSCPTYHVATVKIGGFEPVGNCPRRRWPAEDGTVRWLGFRWWGVPMPLRALIGTQKAWATFRTSLAPGYLPGCGCSVGLKALWARVAVWKRYNVASATKLEPPHGSVATDQA